MSGLGFSCALITGGGGGLGKALGAHFVQHGKKVILAGRTESKLKSAAAEIGAADYYVLDTGRVATIPAFLTTLLARHPDVDCLVNNAGVQRPLYLVEDAAADFLAKADEEIDINIRGPMHLTLGLLPHFRSLAQGATIVNVSSILGFVPLSVINPVYNGTKAWLHFWTMAARSQLARAGYEKIKLVEIAPPAVGTDLHRDRPDPDDNKKFKNPEALTIEEFMAYVAAGFERGEQTIAPGKSEAVVTAWYREFGEQYEKVTGTNGGR